MQVLRTYRVSLGFLVPSTIFPTCLMKFLTTLSPAPATACLVLFSACFCLENAACAADLQAGFAQVDITPPIGAIITGPMGPLSTATDDPLKARAMVVASGGKNSLSWGWIW